jgi:hypothetical protein
MKILRKFSHQSPVISLLFIGCARLISFAGFQLWQGIEPVGARSLPQRLNAVLDSIALLTVASLPLNWGNHPRRRRYSGKRDESYARPPILIPLHGRAGRRFRLKP